MIKYSIILPCYNELENFFELLNRLSKIIDSDNTEVIFVDNGSNDGTEIFFKSYLLNYKFARTIRVEINKGYGYGIMQGLKIAKGSIIGWTHADLQTDPLDIVRAIDILEKQKNLDSIYVKGSRIERPVHDKFFTRSMEVLVKMILKQNLTEINAQPNLFSKKLLDNCNNPPNHWGLDLYFYSIAEKLSYNFIRLPVSFPKRIHGKSKWNKGFFSKIKLSLKMLNYCFEIRKNENNKS